MSGKSRLVIALAIVASASGIGGLMPLAFGMAAIAKPIFPFGNALVLLIALGGPLLLLAYAGKAILIQLSILQFLTVFTCVVSGTGLLLFWRLPGHGLIIDWVAMAITASLIAVGLRLTWLWAVVGGLWAGTLLGILALGSTLAFLSPTPRGFPTWMPLWSIGCILSISTSTLVVVRRKAVS